MCFEKNSYRKDMFSPAIVLLSDYSIPTSCVCFDWSEIKNTQITRFNQASEQLQLLFCEFIIKYLLQSFHRAFAGAKNNVEVFYEINFCIEAVYLYESVPSNSLMQAVEASQLRLTPPYFNIAENR